jgi:hypothetical protein
MRTTNDVDMGDVNAGAEEVTNESGPRKGGRRVKKTSSSKDRQETGQQNVKGTPTKVKQHARGLRSSANQSDTNGGTSKGSLPKVCYNQFSSTVLFVYSDAS